METRIRLVTRGDDAGSCPSADRAVVEASERGVLRNVSVMVPGPSFAHAAGLLAGLRGVDLGLHVTLNAEWDGPKWGPVLPPERVPSLVDANGMFLPTPNDLHARGASVDEMVAEVEAQLDRARAYGLNIAYIDEHMGVGWQSGLLERLIALAQREGLALAATVEGLPGGVPETGDRVSDWIARITSAAPGTYVLVTHPGFDAGDMRAFGHSGQEPGEVARDRDADRRAWCDPRLRRALEENGVAVVRYTDVLTA